VAGLSAAATLPTAVACLGLLALPLLTASLAGRFPTAERTPA